MSGVTLFYNNWQFWSDYNPANGLYGNQKVTFDGINRLILINYGETEINVQEDIYSGWKEWSKYEDNLKYAQALSAVGGDPITQSTKVGITYFLENGWRIKPFSGSHILSMVGNIYTREPGEDPYVVADGNFKVTVNTVRSNLVDLISLPGAGLTESDQLKLDELHKLQGLDPDNPLQVTDSLRTAGPTIRQIISGEDPVTVQRDN